METQSLVNKGSFWFPEAISTYAHLVDNLYGFVQWISVILLTVLTLWMIYFIIKYRRRKGNEVASGQLTHHLLLEVLWTVIPTVLVMFIFVWGYKDYLTMSAAPSNALPIRVIGQQWAWIFTYPDTGRIETNTLTVPVNTPIKLIMSAKDSYHSFFVPNFRIKRNLVPNRYTTLWFEATKVGAYRLYCAELCGDGHSRMTGAVNVVSKDDYDAFLESGDGLDASVPLDIAGKKVYDQLCAACHSVDGSKMTCPTLLDVYGTKRNFSNSESLVADENYIRESLLEPNKKLVKGFAGIMPSFNGLLKDAQIDALIAYIQTLKSEGN